MTSGEDKNKDIISNKENWIDLNSIPKKKCKNRIITDWKNSINCECKFKYKNINGTIKIIDYISNKKDSKIKICYNNNYLIMTPSHLKECKIGKLLKVYGSDYRYEIGQIFKDDKRDLIIIDREIRKGNKCSKKWYKYKCNNKKCNYEGFISENNITSGIGCACCSNKIVIKGINDISTTNPKMVKYFKNIEDAYTHTYSSSKKVWCKCPSCGFEKEMKINTLYRYGFSCPICSDGISYPEKVMLNMLKQLKIDFKTQLNSTIFKWCDKYRYDFYFKLNYEQYIIETHGGQHYENTGFKSYGGRTLEEEQENDRVKKELALRNNIKEENYIVIDCRYSKIDFIKNNIIHSELNDIFDLSNIDWHEIDRQSQKSLVKEVCDYWNLHNNINNEKIFTEDISKLFNISKTTIKKYLEIGNNNGMCIYYKYEEGKEILINHRKNLAIKSMKPVEIFKDGKSFGKFKSITELEKQSENLFGVKLNNSKISQVCNINSKRHMELYKGFNFRYV